MLRDRLERLRHSPLTHVAFEIGILFKAIDGLVELVGGAILLFVPTGAIHHTVKALTRHELSEDPNDFIATHLRHLVEQFSADVQLFAAIYLIVHGVVKIGLVWGMFRTKLWAYPAAMVIFGAFVVYQMYEYALVPSFWLLALSVLDTAVIALTWIEYRRVKARTHAAT